MKKINTIAKYLMLAPILYAALHAAPALTAPASSKLWCTGYMLSDDDSTGRYPMSKVDFHAMSCIIDFAIWPGTDGDVDPKRLMPVKHTEDLIAAAHAAGCKVTVDLASDDNAVNLHADVSDKYRAKFVQELVSFVVSRGYDGLDLDYEPLEDSDISNFTKFSDALRQGLDHAKPGLLLTAATGSEPGMFAVIQNDYDQINLMTYELSGKFPGFKSWYNSNLYGDPTHTMENYEPYPSCDQEVRSFIDAGVAPSKIAVATTFGGHVWTGVSGPRQSIQGRKDVTYDDDGDDYKTLMDSYWDPSRYRWDDVAHASYLSIVGATPADSKFIVYDDQRSIADKFDYARKMGLGGVMVWEIGGGYRANQPDGQRDILLQTVKQAWTGQASSAPAQ